MPKHETVIAQDIENAGYNIYIVTAVPLTVRGMEWGSLHETVCRMAGFLLLGNCSCIALLPSIHEHMQNLHFHHPWRSERHPSVHGRIYSVSQATDHNSCLG